MGRTQYKSLDWLPWKKQLCKIQQPSQMRMMSIESIHRNTGSFVTIWTKSYGKNHNITYDLELDVAMGRHETCMITSNLLLKAPSIFDSPHVTPGVTFDHRTTCAFEMQQV